MAVSALHQYFFVYCLRNRQTCGLLMFIDVNFSASILCLIRLCVHDCIRFCASAVIHADTPPAATGMQV